MVLLLSNRLVGTIINVAPNNNSFKTSKAQSCALFVKAEVLQKFM
jgi:hypothetical protein